MSRCTLPVLEQKRTGYLLPHSSPRLAGPARANWCTRCSYNITIAAQRLSLYFGLAGMIFSCLILLPSAANAESNRGPDVVIVAEENRVVYEFRQNGQLRYIRVVPKRGKPYYLVPTDATKGNGDLERVDSLVTSWVLWEFD